MHPMQMTLTMISLLAKPQSSGRKRKKIPPYKLRQDEMIRLTHEYAIDANSREFVLMTKTTPKKPGERGRWVPDGYYPTLKTLVRGLSDRHLYASVQRMTALSDVQEELVSWSSELKSPLVADLRAAIKAFE